MRIVLSFFFLFALPVEALDQYPTKEAAAFYDTHSKQQWTAAFSALATVSFTGNEKVLDIGSGAGKISANLAGRVPQGSVIGLELSHGMTQSSQENFALLYQNLSFTEGNALELTYDSEFDLVTSFNTLHWIQDQEALLTKVHQALKEEGKILFSIPCKPLPQVGAALQNGWSKEPWITYLAGYNHPRRKFTVDEYKGLLEQAGFKNIEVEEVPLTYYFENKKEFADWFAAFSPILFYIPQELKGQFLADLVESYIATIPMREDGQLVLEQNELIIRATK